ncbi:DUF1926 domain-containing protein [candidate division WOR-3 bacterium]|nr:DUF1926 domain-containing protein [candidate division WOR-3 bacterium]
MMRFALYLHNHQPAGNFDSVFEYAYEHAYEPLLKVLLKHPRIKFGIHNSGTLLEWILNHHPEFFAMLKQAVTQQQAELLSSGYGEPILSLVPRKDAIEQIKYYNDFLYEHFEYRPKGLWLTERIWEPQLIPTLLDAGIEYLLLDDTHFLYAGLQHDDLYSYFITEDDGRILKVFPISMKLRYLIPFHQINETMDFLKDESSKRIRGLKTLGDDGEKFGVWPGTYDWVHTKGWLESFLERLENEPWIETTLLKDVAQEEPAGRIYLPTSSYEEMGEWVLPPDRGNEYEELKNLLDRKYYYLLHGGYFKNFLQRYPEANHMHKRMLYVSRRVLKSKKAKLALWRGQCSCAYWHGIFGGLYLPHLRDAVYHNLIEADNLRPEQTMEKADFNADGKDEIVFSNKALFAVIDPKTGSFMELDDRARKTNLCNYLGRRKEKYHQRIPQQPSTDNVRSIHESFRSKEENMHQYLIYDTYERRFGLDHILATMPMVDDLRHGNISSRIIHYPEFTITDPASCGISFAGEIEKRIALRQDGEKTIVLSYAPLEGMLGIEFSIGVFCANFRLDSGQKLADLICLEGITQFSLCGDGLEPIAFSADRPFTFLSYPIETISSSESGYERIFQGCCFLLVFTSGPIVSIRL